MGVNGISPRRWPARAGNCRWPCGSRRTSGRWRSDPPACGRRRRGGRVRQHRSARRCSRSADVQFGVGGLFRLRGSHRSGAGSHQQGRTQHRTTADEQRCWHEVPPQTTRRRPSRRPARSLSSIKANRGAETVHVVEKLFAGTDERGASNGGIHFRQRLASSRRSHSFAKRQSRLTVSTDTCRASAVSSRLRPPK